MPFIPDQPEASAQASSFVPDETQRTLRSSRELAFPQTGKFPEQIQAESPEQRQFELEHAIRAAISQYGRPALEFGGLLAGGTLASPGTLVSGPVASVAGAGLGFAGGKSLANALDIFLETPQGKELAKRTILQSTGESALDIGEGALAEAGGAAIGPIIGRLVNTPLRAASGFMRGSAERSVGQALRPTTLESKAITERITPEILERPVETFAFTQKGLVEKSEAAREAAGQAIEAFGKLKGDVNPQQVVSALENLKKPYIVAGKEIDPAAIASIEEMQGVFNQFGNSISKEDLRQVARTFGQQISEAKGYTKDVAQASVLKVKKVADASIRKILSEKEPDLAKLNKNFNFWANLNDVATATQKRTLGQQMLAPTLAGIAGAASPGSGEDRAARALAFAAIVRGIRSPGWKLASAQAKNGVAKSLSNLAIPEEAAAVGAKAVLNQGLPSLQESIGQSIQTQ